MRPSGGTKSHNRFRYMLGIILVVLLPELAVSFSEPTRFFRIGDGQIHIRNEHSGREANVSLFDTKGDFNEKALRER